MTNLFIFLDIFCFLVSTFILITIILVYKNRKHPYLKVISPSFSILMCIGFMMNGCGFVNTGSYSIFDCNIGYIISTIEMNLLLLPMLIVTYRIYCVIKAKRLSTKKLDDKHLLLYFSIIFGGMILYKILVHCFNETYILSFGFIDSLRFPSCYYDNYKIFEIIDMIYVYTIFAVILVMIILTGKASKRF
ncbi:hypothetical protein BCR36DRAFT_327745, partial [Piromyces finnis]